jgi:hypothetical protein
LPPSIVLEVLRILKAEMNLRDQTRVAEQTRPSLLPHDVEAAADELKESQEGLLTRTEDVIDRIEELERTQGKSFPKALQRLGAASSAMSDATDLLAATETGPPTIAAETEAIEALLVTTRSGGGGGGGGDSPGGGKGSGPANEAASALAGLGDGFDFEQRIVDQAVGTTRSDIPDEFRAGLDAYFGAVDGRSGG